MQWFVNNREVIKNLALNTGTSNAEAFTNMCTTSEINITTDFEKRDFYIFCDAIRRSIITGASLSIDTTVKLDINNSAIQKVIAKIHDLIVNGEVAQFNNELVQFELLEKVTSNALTYKKYKVPVSMTFSDLGGGAEEEGEFALNMTINGKGTLVTS